MYLHSQLLCSHGDGNNTALTSSQSFLPLGLTVCGQPCSQSPGSVLQSISTSQVTDISWWSMGSFAFSISWAILVLTRTILHFWPEQCYILSFARPWKHEEFCIVLQKCPEKKVKKQPGRFCMQNHEACVCRWVSDLATVWGSTS